MIKQMKIGKALKKLSERIMSFEKEFGISSHTMLRELKVGIQKETLEVCQWIMALRLKERLEKSLESKRWK